MGTTPTKAENDHMDAVAALGCIACRNMGFGYSPACIHHTYHGRKGGRDHMLVLPLCDEHHRNTGRRGVAFHAGRHEWERIHGTEAELLDQVAGLLELSR